MKPCLSHPHYACPCREEAFKNLLKASKFALKLAKIELQEALEEGHLPLSMTIAAIQESVRVYTEAIQQGEEKL